MEKPGLTISTKAKIKIGYADDHRMVRQGIISLLQSEPGFEVIMEATDGKELIEKLQAAQTLPDVLLLDVQMPHLDGFGVLRWLRKKLPGPRPVIYSMHGDEEHIKNAILAGAAGYVVKEDDFSELVQAIHIVFEHGSYIAKGIDLSAVFDGSGKADSPELSGRERAILALMCSDLNYQQIAARLCVSVKTVEASARQLFKKFNVASRPGLIVAAFTNRLVHCR